MSTRARTTGLAALAVATAGVGLGAVAHPVRAAGPEPPSRPNIVLITADDMAATDLRYMPRTRKLVGRAGVTVRGFLSNHPLCCPARAEILTGQYGQNNGVRHNAGPHGGYRALVEPGNTVASWLQGAGYATAFVGKYLNAWEKAPRQEPGWTVFNAMTRRVYAYYGVTLFRDGSPKTYPHTHSNDVVAGAVAKYVERFSDSEKPFFIWASPVAPHDSKATGRWGPPVPAMRHRHLEVRGRIPSVSDASFDEARVGDKPRYVRRSPFMGARVARREHVARIRALRSVDDLVGTTVAALRSAGELADTYVVFTSDNGFLIGQHRLKGKNVPYEEALRVPLLVRGPDLPHGAVRRATFGMVDLAPTFLDIGAASADRVLDGRSMLGAWRGDGPGYADYLIQGGSDAGGWWWRGIRSQRYAYVRYANDFVELYDLAHDPDELVNLADRPSYADVRQRFATRLEALESCQGSACLSAASKGG